MRRIRKGIVVELEGRGNHGAKLQKLPPVGRKKGSDESSFTRVPLLAECSYAEEDLAPVHPEKKEPVHEQNTWLQAAGAAVLGRIERTALGPGW